MVSTLTTNSLVLPDGQLNFPAINEAARKAKVFEVTNDYIRFDNIVTVRAGKNYSFPASYVVWGYKGNDFDAYHAKMNLLFRELQNSAKLQEEAQRNQQAGAAKIVRSEERLNAALSAKAILDKKSLETQKSIADGKAKIASIEANKQQSIVKKDQLVAKKQNIEEEEKALRAKLERLKLAKAQKEKKEEAKGLAANSKIAAPATIQAK